MRGGLLAVPLPVSAIFLLSTAGGISQTQVAPTQWRTQMPDYCYVTGETLVSKTKKQRWWFRFQSQMSNRKFRYVDDRIIGAFPASPCVIIHAAAGDWKVRSRVKLKKLPVTLQKTHTNNHLWCSASSMQKLCFMRKVVFIVLFFPVCVARCMCIIFCVIKNRWNDRCVKYCMEVEWCVNCD